MAAKKVRKSKGAVDPEIPKEKKHRRRKKSKDNQSEEEMGGPFAALADEVMIAILRRVSMDTGTSAIRCLEVSKRWNRLGRWAISELSLNEVRTRQLTHYLSKFDCLTHVTLTDCKVSPKLLGTLSTRCPNLSELHLDELRPQLSASDVTALLSGFGRSLLDLEMADSIACNNFPNVLENFPALLSLDLRNNPALQSLPTLLSLTALTSLSLQNCLCLQTAPGLETLTQLEILNLEGCLSLDAPPHPQLLSQLALVQKLSITSPNINSPVPLGRDLKAVLEQRIDAAAHPPLPPLPNLQHISLAYFSKATDLPDMGNLSSNLLSMTIKEYPNLMSVIPLARFRALRSLKLIACGNVDDIEPLRALANLEELALTDCDVIHVSFTFHFSKLTSLEMRECEVLETLKFSETMVGLRSLSLEGCAELKEIHSLSILSRLTRLNLWECYDLESAELLTPLIRMKSLSEVKLTVPNNFVRTARLVLPGTLKTLGFDLFSSAPPLDPLPLLHHLIVRGCGTLRTLPGTKFPLLSSITIENCDYLTTVAPIADLPTLTSITIKNCKALTALPSLQKLTCMTSISIAACNKLVVLPPVESLPQLSLLSVRDCTKLKFVHAVASLPCLSFMDFEGCRALRTIAVFDRLPTLRTLDLAKCRRLSTLPISVGACTALQELSLESCCALKELPFLTELTSLEELDVAGCRSLARLPALTGLQWLGTIYATKDLVIEGVLPTTVVFRYKLNAEQAADDSGSDVDDGPQ